MNGSTNLYITLIYASVTIFLSSIAVMPANAAPILMLTPLDTFEPENTLSSSKSPWRPFFLRPKCRGKFPRCHRTASFRCLQLLNSKQVGSRFFNIGNGLFHLLYIFFLNAINLLSPFSLHSGLLGLSKCERNQLFISSASRVLRAYIRNWPGPSSSPGCASPKPRSHLAIPLHSFLRL